MIMLRIYYVEGVVVERTVWEQGFERMDPHKLPLAVIADLTLNNFTDGEIITRLGVPHNKDYQILCEVLVDESGEESAKLEFKNVKYIEIPPKVAEGMAPF